MSIYQKVLILIGGTLIGFFVGLFTTGLAADTFGWRNRTGSVPPVILFGIPTAWTVVGLAYAWLAISPKSRSPLMVGITSFAAGLLVAFLISCLTFLGEFQRTLGERDYLRRKLKELQGEIAPAKQPP